MHRLGGARAKVRAVESYKSSQEGKEAAWMRPNTQQKKMSLRYILEAESARVGGVRFGE